LQARSQTLNPLNPLNRFRSRREAERALNDILADGGRRSEFRIEEAEDGSCVIVILERDGCRVAGGGWRVAGGGDARRLKGAKRQLAGCAQATFIHFAHCLPWRCSGAFEGTVMNTKPLLIALALLGSTGMVVGCEQKTSLQKAGDDLKDAAHDTGDAMKDAAHDAKTAVLGAAHDAKDAAKDIGNDIKKDTEGKPN
jgi:hypothetical protein